ncbi:MAG: hydrogenase 3 maturation endopeptidase HyCI [Anaerolineaceae bacterium]|nr:hydrogenase 3 maturation endopeptidase HyCI [Anaerolineaceae bacterium]
MDETKISKHCWQSSLQATLNRLQNQKAERPFRLAILGVGQTLRSDDGVGLAVVRGLRPYAHPNLLLIEAAHAPENCTGQVRRFAPDLVLLIDAAKMDEPLGTIRWLDWRCCDGLSASTHTMPLSLLGEYFTAVLHCEVALIGIQPASLEMGEMLSPEATAAAEQVMEVLAGICLPV